MRNVVAIAAKDLKTYFVTPIGYLVITVFVGIMSWMFCAALFEFLKRSQAYMQFGGMSEMNVNAMVIQPVLGNMAVIFLFLVSLITMRLLAEERKMRTLELLLTSPLHPVELVLGKFLSALLLFSVMLAVTLFYPLILMIFGGIDIKQVLAGYLGVFLLGASFLSFGLFISALTENQITAGALTFGLCLFFWIISWLSGSSDSVAGQLLSYISIIDHLSNFIRGLIDTKDIVYYLSFITLGLFLTYQSIESYRWR
ncbi:MAG: ABC transporter permease [Deltaproteobacteria bacterium]|nr:ABC transporter permease [Deltaproteobacteria bacterium]